MNKYIMLYKDEKNQNVFYYNINDGGLYTNNIKASSSKKKSYVNIIWGLSIIVYLFAARVAFDFNVTGMLNIITVSILGLIAAVPSFYFSIQMTEKFFIIENRREISFDEAKALFEKNKAFMAKFRKFVFLLITIALFGSIFFSFYPQNVIIYICNIGIWWSVGLLIGSSRPICRQKFELALKKGFLYRA